MIFYGPTVPEINYSIIFYSFRRILLTLRERLNSSTLPCSNVIDAANSLMTKTGVAVTAIFVVTIGYDAIYHMLGSIGVVVFVLNSPVQKIGILLAAFNSVANPFVYVLLMPAFRDSIGKTFHLPTLRCAVVNKSAVVDISNAASNAVTGGNEPATIVTSCQQNPEIPPASPKQVQVEMTPVKRTE